jgi:hypothetical protein
MKKSDDKFEWTEEADTTFAQLKKVLSTPLLYIAATHQVVSMVLVVDRSKEGKAHGVQRPSYLQQSRGTRAIESLHTAYSQQHKSCGNILRCTQS